MADPLTEPFRRFSLAWEVARPRGAEEEDDGLLLDEPLPQMCVFQALAPGGSGSSPAAAPRAPSAPRSPPSPLRAGRSRRSASSCGRRGSSATRWRSPRRWRSSASA